MISLNHIRPSVEEPKNKRLKTNFEEAETHPEWKGYELKRSTKYYIEKMMFISGSGVPDRR